MFGIKGYIFIDGEKMPFENPPFEAITGYSKANEFMQMTINSIEKDLTSILKGEKTPKCTGYMFVLVPAKEVK